jgi:3-deoxy-D-manno-octulosonate 8-phosphate phosphatase (KDO 8-P phosphatase)
MDFPPEVLSRAKKVELLLLDVDGILTDGGIILTSSGEEIKVFSVLDGMGIKLLQEIGVEVGIVSSRTSKVVELRGKELGIELIIQGELDKLSAVESILKQKGLTFDSVAYMGDDWVDIPLLKRAGLAISVPNAWPPVKDYAHYITTREGGKGAVREVCELIIRAKGKWEELFSRYSY